MSSEELFDRYCEETGVLEDANNLVVILYGSRVTGKNDENSDLDVFIVSKDDKKDKEQIIDGVRTQTKIFPYNTLSDEIRNRFWDCNAYLEAVFETGIVKKDTLGIVELFKAEIQFLKANYVKPKEELPKTAIEEIYFNFEDYKNAVENEKKFYYSKLLDWVYLAYHYIHQYSFVDILKVYRLYTDISSAINHYRLDVAPCDFRQAFLDALTFVGDMDENLKRLFEFIEFDWEKQYSFYREKGYYSRLINFKSNRNMRELSYLNGQVCKTEDLLVKNSKDATFAYYWVLYELKESYPKLCGEDINWFNLQIETAIHTNDVNERIDMLEKLLHLMDYKYELDYDDYTL